VVGCGDEVRTYISFIVFKDNP
jgi:hypothetical protein